MSQLPFYNETFPRQLTANQVEFCVRYVKNGGRPGAAYIDAYPNFTGPQNKAGSMARKLLADERVEWYIGVLQDDLAADVDEIGHDLADHIAELEKIKDAAMAAGAYSAALQAEKAIGVAMGHQNSQGSRSLPDVPSGDDNKPGLWIQRPQQEGDDADSC